MSDYPTDPWGDEYELGSQECPHDWMLRPESDTWQCLMCGAER